MDLSYSGLTCLLWRERQGVLIYEAGQPIHAWACTSHGPLSGVTAARYLLRTSPDVTLRTQKREERNIFIGHHALTGHSELPEDPAVTAFCLHLRQRK